MLTLGANESLGAKPVPSNVKRMMQRKGINWVEIGICPDLSTIRGYYLDKENKLHQKTGSGWEFRPSEVYVKLTPEEEKSFCS